MLSGFLIGGILLDARREGVTFRVFYTRRFFRIMPLYFLLLATYGVVRFVDNHRHYGLIYYWYSEFPVWYYFVFLQNYRMVHDAVFGAPWPVVSWSLAVEQQFYLIIPWVLYHVRGWLLVFLGACCVLSGPLLRHGVTANIQLSDRLDALAVGVLLALLVCSPSGRAVLDQGRRGWRVVVCLYLLAVAGLRIANIDSPGLFSWTTMALIYALVIHLLTDGTEWPVVKPAIEVLAPIGLLSYFIYLFHVPVLYLFGVFLPHITAAALPVTVGRAALSYRFYERPLIRLGHRLHYRQSEIQAKSPGGLPAEGR